MKTTYPSEVTCPRLFLKGVRLPDLNEKTGTEDDDNYRRRLFQQAITKLLSPFGTVHEVFVPERSKKKQLFAMVTMATREQAAAVYQQWQQQPQTPTAETLWFDSIHPAKALPPPSSKQRLAPDLVQSVSKKQRLYSQQIEHLQSLAKSANWILQCTKSHVERLMEYLKNHSQDIVPFEIIGWHAYQTSCLIFCRVSFSSPNELSLLEEWLESIWYLQSSIQRSFIFDTEVPPMLLQVNGLPDPSTVVQTILTSYRKKEPANLMRLRLNTFPRKLQMPLLQALEQYEASHAIVDNKTNDKFVFAPWKGVATHRLSVVRLVSPVNKLNKDDHPGLYLIGLSQAPPSDSTGDDENDVAKRRATEATAIPDHKGLKTDNDFLSDGCCRAYWKLQEALERYQENKKDTSWKQGRQQYFPSPRTDATTNSDLWVPDRRLLNSSSFVGMDVGAAPGGWTQFLVQECRCGTVYSIDPGALDPRVLAMTDLEETETTSEHSGIPAAFSDKKRKPRSIVQHIPMTFQKALPEIAKRRRRRHCQDTPNEDTALGDNLSMDWYVSDMCVKNLGGQVDALFQAVDLGFIQASKTFVILTLKCTRGYSKATFDHLVQEQVQRIDDHMEHLEVLHLFANRQSERTVMGFWK